MTARNDNPGLPHWNLWRSPSLHRRMSLLAVVVGALLVMGFYSVTDAGRLAHDVALDGSDWVGYAICHRITERSFVINGRQLSLCARCTGMYLGVMLVFVVLMLSGRLRWSGLPPFRIILLLISLIGLMGIDGVNSYLHFFPNAPHLYEPRNWLRLLTGMGTGLAMGLLIFPSLAQTLWRRQDASPVVANWREFGALLLLAVALVVALLSNQGIILYLMALASAAGVLIILAAIQTILLLMIIKRDGQATGWIQSAVPLSIGLLLTIVEIAAVSILRFGLTGTLTGFPGL